MENSAALYLKYSTDKINDTLVLVLSSDVWVEHGNPESIQRSKSSWINGKIIVRSSLGGCPLSRSSSWYLPLLITDSQILDSILNLTEEQFKKGIFIMKSMEPCFVLFCITFFRFTEKTLDLEEETNFYFGPSNQVLIRLGAKYTPCMRRDKQIYDIIDCERNLEKDTACCVNAAVRHLLPVATSTSGL